MSSDSNTFLAGIFPSTIWQNKQSFMAQLYYINRLNDSGFTKKYLTFKQFRDKISLDLRVGVILALGGWKERI